VTTVRGRKKASHLMRASVVLDDDLVREAIEEALRRLVQIGRQQRISELFGKVEWEGDLHGMRWGRFPFEEHLGLQVLRQ
jgi:hypothetical protein